MEVGALFPFILAVARLDISVAQFLSGYGSACTTTTTCGTCGFCQSSICVCAPGCQLIGNTCGFHGFGGIGPLSLGSYGFPGLGSFGSGFGPFSGGLGPFGGGFGSGLGQYGGGLGLLGSGLGLLGGGLSPLGGGLGPLGGGLGPLGGGLGPFGGGINPLGGGIGPLGLEFDGIGGPLSILNPGAQCGLSLNGYCGGGSYCTGGYCSCRAGYTLQNSICVSTTTTTSMNSIPYVGQSCSGISQCGGGAFCSSGICACPTNFIMSGFNCIPSINLFGGVGFNVGNQYFGTGNGLGGCGLNGLAYPGYACGSGCSCGYGASCVSSICTCPTNYIIQNNACIMQQSFLPLQSSFIPVGSACGGGISQMCVSGASCVQSTCQCGTGWFRQNSMCIRKRFKPFEGIPSLKKSKKN